MKSKSNESLGPNVHSIQNFNLQFDKPEHIVYFNNSGKTSLPRSIEEAGRKALHQECHPWTMGEECTSEIRSLFAQIINSSSKDIAIVPSTGFAMTLVAKNLFDVDTKKTTHSHQLKKQRLLILQDENASEVYCWQEFCDQIEFVIVPHPRSTGGWTELIMEGLQKDIDICCVPQTHWSDGSYIDLKLIGHYCKQNNITLVIDGTQSVGIMPIDVKEIHCDVLACSVHKWLLGPIGMALVYINPRYHDTWMPLDQHERSRVAFQNEVYDATENNIGCCGYPAKFIDGAGRCDSGGKKNPILQPMVCEGLKIVNSLNLNDAQSFLRGISDQVLEGGRQLGFDVQPGPRVGHIIGLRPTSPNLMRFLTPEKMVEVANNLRIQKCIYIAVRNGAFRISPYLNSTSEDVRRLLEALEEECKEIS